MRGLYVVLFLSQRSPGFVWRMRFESAPALGADLDLPANHQSWCAWMQKIMRRNKSSSNFAHMGEAFGKVGKLGCISMANPYFSPSGQHPADKFSNAIFSLPKNWYREKFES